MIEIGMAMRRDDRAAQVAEEEQHDQRGEERAEHEVLLHRVDARCGSCAELSRTTLERVAGGQRVARRRRAARAPRRRPRRCSCRIACGRRARPRARRRGARRCSASSLPSSTRADVARRGSGGRPCSRTTMRADARAGCSTRPRTRSVSCSGPVSTWPPGVVMFCARDRALHVAASRPAARSFTGSSQTLIWRLRPPRTITWPDARRRSRSGGARVLSATSVISRMGLLGVDRDVEDRRGVGIELGDDRRVDVLAAGRG